MKAKRTALEVVFSDLIRERSNYRCERCKSEFARTIDEHEDGDGRHPSGLHCSHYWSRRHKATRHDPDNAAALCNGCHRLFDQNKPLKYRPWKIRSLGLVRFDELEVRHRTTVRRYKNEVREMTSHYRDELRRIQDLRNTGQAGWIEVIGWES